MITKTVFNIFHYISSKLPFLSLAPVTVLKITVGIGKYVEIVDSPHITKLQSYASYAWAKDLDIYTIHVGIII